jgi:5-methyltetrahydrofolate--homocysteine methyltransferase
MDGRKRIQRLLKKKILILDGATGTELQKRGMPAGACPEVWCRENPEAIGAIHRAYRQAGSDLVYTCTFGGNRLKLSQYGIGDVRGVNRDLAALARRAVGAGTLVAGSIGPTGHFVEPFGDLVFEDAVGIFREQAEGLLDGGVDCFVIETMMDIQEARAALIAVRELGSFFSLVTMTFEKEGRTLNGTDPVTALITLQSLGADAVGCNCSTGPSAMLEFVEAMKPYATVPLVAKPNAGMPRLSGGRTIFDMDAPSFGAFAGRFAAAGVNLVGGCCGTEPDHIRELAQALRDAAPVPPRRKSLGAVSSARNFLLFDRDRPLMIVGERLNPTGKKALQQELLEGKTAIVRQMAREQEKQGADLLDVNVGVPGIDEVGAIRTVVSLLATITGLPLVIDSSRVETMEAALRCYPGRALINSISGEKEKLARLLPLAARYGAMFILLPLTDGEVPETAARRREVVQDVFREAKAYGFTKDDIVIDGLVMTVASNPGAGLEAVRTVDWCANTFGCRTLLGLSNVSFGMPERQWINATFLAMAQAHGLSMAIANPASDEIMNTKFAGDVLMRKDRDAAAYIARFSGRPEAGAAKAPAESLSAAEKVAAAIVEGNREDIVSLVENAIAAGMEASALMDEVMIPAIVRVGDLFDKKIYFLPQLMASAETMKKAVVCLEPRLLEGKAAHGDKGAVVLATVKGDIHDIGKNIVALLLRNHGYRVIDLGKDVAAEEIVAAVRRERPQVVGLSALMTTTMVNMKEVIALTAREGLTCRFLVGGAVVTESYAASIGAAYAKDGVEAVRAVERLIASSGTVTAGG